MIFEKCPFKGNGKLSNFFRLIPRGLNLPAGSHTPQNKILRGIRLRSTRSCGVSDPAEQSLAGIKTWGTTFKYECEFNCEFGDYVGSIRGKNQGVIPFSNVT
jgi:hypothetical protein